MCASLPFLVALVRGFMEDGVMRFMSVGCFRGEWYGMDYWVLVPLLVVFMVKLPVFGAHR